MSQHLLKLIRAGATAEIADAIRDDPSLASCRDPQGVSALMWSVYSGQPMARDFLLNELLAQGLDLDIFEAAATGDIDRLHQIFAEDADAVSAHSADGWTALHLAAAFSTPDVVSLLLEHGAAVGALSTNAQRNQPLHASLALSRDPVTIQTLLENGADANAVQAGGYTPIFTAASANRRDLAGILLSFGADAHRRNDEGKTAADFARERGYEDLAAWLDSQPS